jgi:hypothetical protein
MMIILGASRGNFLFLCRADDRLRFTRLTRIKTLLGGTPEEMYYPPDASKYVEDDDYLVVDFSLNWVSTFRL